MKIVIVVVTTIYYRKIVYEGNILGFCFEALQEKTFKKHNTFTGSLDTPSDILVAYRTMQFSFLKLGKCYTKLPNTNLRTIYTTRLLFIQSDILTS